MFWMPAFVQRPATQNAVSGFRISQYLGCSGCNENLVLRHCGHILRSRSPVIVRNPVLDVLPCLHGFFVAEPRTDVVFLFIQPIFTTICVGSLLDVYRSFTHVLLVSSMSDVSCSCPKHSRRQGGEITGWGREGD